MIAALPAKIGSQREDGQERDPGQREEADNEDLCAVHTRIVTHDSYREWAP